MEARKPVFGKSNSVEDMQHVRLMALLQELEREHGRKGAAAVLGLDHRTLGASLDDGVLSRRVRGALERALQEGIGSAADRQRERNDGLEKRLEELEGVVEAQGKEMRVGRRALEDAMRAGRDETARALRELETRLTAVSTRPPDVDCAAALDLTDQDPTINQMMASLVLQVVRRMVEGSCPFLGLYLDMEQGTVTPRYVTPEAVVRIVGPDSEWEISA